MRFINELEKNLKISDNLIREVSLKLPNKLFNELSEKLVGKLAAELNTDLYLSLEDMYYGIYSN